RGLFDSVVLAPISVGGSRIEEWTTGGARHRRLQVAIKRAMDSGFQFTHLLWHQGETNARHDPDGPLYAACFMNIHAALRRYGVPAPIYVAQATVCDSPPNEVIRAAQRAVVDPRLGIFAGPDTDTIGFSDRYDNCHMAESGLIKHAKLWIEILGDQSAPALRTSTCRLCPETGPRAAWAAPEVSLLRRRSQCDLLFTRRGRVVPEQPSLPVAQAGNAIVVGILRRPPDEEAIAHFLVKCVLRPSV